MSPLHLCVGVEPAGPCEEKWNVKPRVCCWRVLVLRRWPLSCPWAIGDGLHLCGRGLSACRLVEQCGLAVVKMGWIPNAANPTTFLGPVIYGKLSWPVDAAVWPGAFILDGGACSGDMLLHLKHTHPACHSRVVWSMFGAQSMWRLIRTSRGQHSGMMSGGGFGGLSLGLSSSSEISGTGHSTLAARRVCSS